MLIAVDKPISITSYDVIRRLKPLYPKQKIWHSGTLDPMATWLMLIWVWSDTKRLTQLTWLDKSYIATIDFSQDSDTRDLQYRDWLNQFELISSDSEDIWIIKDFQQILAPSLDQIQAKLDLLIPSYDLPLTPFSAKKLNWKKLYELAREGKEIIQSRQMKTHWYKIINYSFPTLQLQLDVGSWTYIRSIAHRLWSEFGLGWILTSLRRITIGEYDLQDYTLQTIASTQIKYCEII